MQSIPVKKFEKLSSEVTVKGRAVVTKITDYRRGVVFYEVICGETKTVFKTLEEARKHLAAIPKSEPRAGFSQTRIGTINESPAL
jgi:hypothetical protein